MNPSVAATLVPALAYMVGMKTLGAFERSLIEMDRSAADNRGLRIANPNI